jgi:hypothetical protein
MCAGTEIQHYSSSRFSADCELPERTPERITQPPWPSDASSNSPASWQSSMPPSPTSTGSKPHSPRGSAHREWHSRFNPEHRLPTRRTSRRSRTGSGPVRLIAALWHCQRRFTETATVAGLSTVHACERHRVSQISATNAALLLAPLTKSAGLARKFIVIIALSKPGPVGGATFPGADLRTPLADQILVHRPVNANS